MGSLCTATVYCVSAPGKSDKMVFVIARKSPSFLQQCENVQRGARLQAKLCTQSGLLQRYWRQL